MTTLHEAAQQALEALTIADNIALVGAAYTPRSIEAGIGKIQTAIESLRAALAQPKTNQCGETCERAKLCPVCSAELTRLSN